MRNTKNLKVLFSLLLVFAVVSSMFMTVMAEPEEALIGEGEEIVAEAEVAAEEVAAEEPAEVIEEAAIEKQQRKNSTLGVTLTVIPTM